MKVQQGLDKIWQWFSEDRRLLDILIAFLLIQVLVVFIPQAPFPRDTGPSYSRWIAELRPALGKLVTPLSAVGLLTLRASLWTRGLLAILVLAVVVRSASLREIWHELASVRKRFHVALCAASLLIVAGWSAQIVWGWKQPEVIAWPDAPVSVPERGMFLPPQKRHLPLWSGQYGLYLIPKGSSVGLEVQAFDEEGNVLPLLPSARGDPFQVQLRLDLTREAPEAYFALPDEELVFRVSSIHNNGTHVQAQVYRSASGDLLAEKTLQDNGSLFADNIRLNLDYYVLPRFEAVYNPGAIFEGLGILILIAVVVGQWRAAKTAQDDDVSEDSESDPVESKG